mgnify:FL=1
MLITRLPSDKLSVNHVKLPVFVSGIDVFHPIITLVGIIQILSKAMPSGLLSRTKMCYDRKTYRKPLLKLIYEHKLVHIRCI